MSKYGFNLVELTRQTTKTPPKFYISITFVLSRQTTKKIPRGFNNSNHLDPQIHRFSFFVTILMEFIQFSDLRDSTLKSKRLQPEAKGGAASRFAT